MYKCQYSLLYAKRVRGYEAVGYQIQDGDRSGAAVSVDGRR